MGIALWGGAIASGARTTRHISRGLRCGRDAYAHRMDQDGPKWARLRLEMRAAREAKGLSLATMARGLMGKENLSRIETGGRSITRPIIERYAALTGIAAFVAAFDHLTAEAHQPPGEPAGELPLLGSLLVSAEVEQTVDVGKMIKIVERRVVSARLHPVGVGRIGMHFDRIDGRRPVVHPVTAYRADITAQGWVSASNYAVNLKFPDGAITPETDPYEYTLIVEYEASAPYVAFMSRDPLSHYEMSIRFPSTAFKVFELDGVPEPIARDFVEAISRGEDTPLRSKALNASREVARDFFNLQPSLMYGMAWAPRAHFRLTASKTPD
jgi:transcriptional regulator with XRE-family HTH domain